jgi:hypothetical protein
MIANKARDTIPDKRQTMVQETELDFNLSHGTADIIHELMFYVTE